MSPPVPSLPSPPTVTSSFVGPARRSWWEDVPGVLAGRDLEAGGTWLGVSRDGRFAALTNYRAPFDIRAGASTRGKLVSDFLGGPSVAPLDYLGRLAEHAAVYNGFNLLVGDWRRRELAWFCNRAPEGESAVSAPVAIAPGVHALSNARLDTRWPKVVRKRAGSARCSPTIRPVARRTDRADARPACRGRRRTAAHRHSDRTRACAVGCVHRDTRIRYARHDRAARHDEGRRAADGRDQERCDDDGSHRTVRPGTFERAFTFDLDATPPR